ncbi:metalloendopeptidase CpaA [Lysobacter firmicutimachus]|uniref:Metalloendopeptidase CpaA n=1 Tax=Lysobacter firmicutimachus TaxID=1792846 RepID=A0AAU8MTY7_9GAMM
MKQLGLGLIAILLSLDALATDLSPSAVGGGDIPGDYPSIDFYISKDDWAPTLTLSNDAADRSTVTIHSSTSKTSNLITGNTDYPLDSMTIYKDDRVTFVYHADKQRWAIEAPGYTPNANGGSGVLPSPAVGKFTRFDIADGDWASTITLPASAPNNSVVAISSRASWAAKISPQNAMYASTFNLRNGDQYVFVYRTNYQRWFSVKTPITALQAASAGAQLAAPATPYTQVKFADGNWIPEITLPATAGDRDRISLSSDAGWTATLANRNLDYDGTLKLFTGARYDFIFIREKGVWTLQSSPHVAFTPNGLGTTQLPNTRSPVMRYTSSDGDWASTVLLPVDARPGDAVIVKSNASWEFDVAGQNTSFGTTRVRNGETYRFVRDAAGLWNLETRIVTMMLMYSQEAVDRLGELAQKMRMLEGLRLTNEALENSKVNFYLRPVGFLKRQFVADTLGDILAVAMKDSVVVSIRAQLAADAVYYEGTEEGCGLAGVTDPKESMLGTGSLNCGVTVMRHEFGHNMGLDHAEGAGGSAPYAKGYLLVEDIMGGNAIPYYSSPNLYLPEYGVPLGIADVTDSVRALNDRSKTVSEYY